MTDQEILDLLQESVEALDYSWARTATPSRAPSKEEMTEILRRMDPMEMFNA